MNTFDALLLILILLGFAGILWFLHKNQKPEDVSTDLKKLIEENAKLKADLENKTQEIGKITQVSKQLQSEKDTLEGRGRQIYADITTLKEENKSLRADRDDLKSQVTKFESEKTRLEKEHEKKMTEAENMRKSWEDEKTRIRREDEEKQEQILEEQNRIWANHENEVIQKLKEICQKPEFSFPYYENTNLPDDFDGSLKPDFLIQFIDRYLIFDAKLSKDMSTYVNDQVKKTAQKIRKSASSETIYTTVFFVIPRQEMETLKKTYFYEEGYTFYIVTVDALEGILGAYKRIGDYEKISEFDPRDRENIVNLIAHYDRHISFQNAANVLLAQEGVKVMHSKENLTEEWQTDVDIKKRSIRPFRLKESDVKKISDSVEMQEKEIKKMTKPKVDIREEDLENVQESLL